MKEHKEDDNAFMNKYGKALQDIRLRLLNSCPETEVLIRYFRKELSGQKQREVVQHVQLCPVCMEAFQSLAEVKKKGKEMELLEKWEEIEKEMDIRVYDYLKSLEVSGSVEESVSRAKVSPGNRLRILWGSVFLFILNRRRLASVGLAISFCLGALYAYALFSRPDYFTFAQIEVEKSGMLRGEASKSETLRSGLQFFAQGEYENTVKLLGTYLTAHPEHFQANYVMGLAYLLDARVDLLGVAYRFDPPKVQQGIRYLEKALPLAGDNAFYQEDCLWYLGKAHLMLGDLEEARKYFEQILNLSQPNLLRKDEARKIILKINEASPDF